MIITWSLSFFFTEIAETNSSIEAYVLVLSKISDGLFVVFFTVFVLRTYSNYIVPLMSDWINIGKSDTQYGPLLDIIGSILIIVFGLTNFLSTFNVEFGVLVAGVGVVGLVIALAAQDTLSNFFSGILLLLDQGFKTGDMIYFNDTYCLIREIGLRSTKIYDIVNHVIIIIPNNALANQNILNLTKPDRYYRLRIEVGVSYDSNPDEVEAALLEVAKENSSIEQDDPTRKPLVRFQNFGDSTLNFALVAWIKNVIKMRQINSDLHHQVFAKLRAEKIVIAFPQRDVHLFHEGVPQAASENKKLNTNYEEPSEIVPENSISDEPNEVTELVEELPDILDETVNLDTDRDEENMAMTALMDELNLLRNEMNTINDNNKKSENEEIKTLKNQLSLMEKSFKESENEEIKSLKSQLSKMEENFRDSENEEINSLKQEISNLKADLMDKEDTDLDEDIDDSKSKKDEEDLAEAQRLIEEIQSRKFD